MSSEFDLTDNRNYTLIKVYDLRILPVLHRPEVVDIGPLILYRIKALRVLMGTAVFKRSSLQIGRFLV